MLNDYTIRLEKETDYRAVEELTRETFWNLYKPGCAEHYVLHTYRSKPEFVRELDFVMEKDGRLIGHVMFVRAEINSDEGRKIPIMTFGPISILPEFQRRGYGRALLDYAGFADYGLNILAAFDIAVAEPVASPKGKYIYPVSELDSFCSEHNARIGIIAVPAEAAQQACNELYNAGIKMMLCLAPCKLIPPNDTIIRYENIAQSLAVLKAQSL